MKQLLSIFSRGLVDVYQLYKIFHLKVFGFFFAIVCIFAVGITLNHFNLMILNGYLGIIFIVVSTYIASQPRIVAGLVGIGVGTKLKEPINGTTDVIEIWTMFLSQIMIWISIFFLICATVHFDRNIGVIPIIVLGLFIIFLAAPMWGFQSELPKKLAYGYTIVIVIVYFACMISPASYKHFTGVDPVKFFRADMSDKKIAEIEDMLEEQADEDREKELEKIEIKIKKREKLTYEEKTFLQDSKKERNNRSIPVKAKGAAASAILAIKGLFGGDEFSDEEKIAIEDGYYVQADKIKIPDLAEIKTQTERQKAITALSKKVPLLAKSCQYTNRYEAEYQKWRERLGFERALANMKTERSDVICITTTPQKKLKPDVSFTGSKRVSYLSLIDFNVSDGAGYTENWEKASSKIKRADLYCSGNTNLFFTSKKKFKIYIILDKI